jgi:hypothetical protein
MKPIKMKTVYPTEKLNLNDWFKYISKTVKNNAK